MMKAIYWLAQPRFSHLDLPWLIVAWFMLLAWQMYWQAFVVALFGSIAVTVVEMILDVDHVSAYRRKKEKAE
jgi:hypothetical protein